VPLLVRNTPLRILLALGAFFVASATFVACGGGESGIPGDAVATVDGQPITRAEFTRWAAITARSSDTTGGRATFIPDPPTFERCVATLREQSRPARGQPAPSDVTLRAQCRARNELIVQNTMSTLIQKAWIEQEAEEQGVTVSDAEVQRQLDETKRQSFPTEAAYQRFLRTSGMTNEDVLERVRAQALARAISDKVQRSAAPVSEDAVQEYYERNRAQFALPERRDVQLILTRSEAQANAAKNAVEGGMSWAAAARQYSIDEASKATGGELRGVSEGQQDRAFDTAAFGARRGTVVGPVRGQFGWYVLRVTSVTPARQTSLEEASGQIRTLLSQQGSQEKMSTFIRDFTERWRDATDCRTGYVVTLCSNAPRANTTSTAGGTVATPSGGSDSGR
jgi:foldase protein PrsA